MLKIGTKYWIRILGNSRENNFSSVDEIKTEKIN